MKKQYELFYKFYQMFKPRFRALFIPYPRIQHRSKNKESVRHAADRWHWKGKREGTLAEPGDGIPTWRVVRR